MGKTQSLMGTVISNEHAILYAYQVFTPHLPAVGKQHALDALSYHRAIRDDITHDLITDHKPIPPEEIQYSLPAVVDSISALKAAIVAEEQSCRVYSWFIEHSRNSLHKNMALQWLQSATATLMQWKFLLHDPHPITPFPGTLTP